MKWYVYSLKDSDGCKYIGHTKNPKTRIKQHYRFTSHPFKLRWLLRNKYSGTPVRMEILGVFDSKHDACEVERELITKLKPEFSYNGGLIKIPHEEQLRIKLEVYKEFPEFFRIPQ